MSQWITHSTGKWASLQSIEKCQIVLETVKPPALTALFTGPVNNSAADLLDTGFASSEGGLDPQCRELVTRTVLDLVEQVVVLLRRVDWANMVGRMRAQLVQHTPGMMHVPMFLTDMEQAWHRPRSCCCWAEVLLLLVYGVFMDERLGFPCVLGECVANAKSAMTYIWQPLCSAMHALLPGLQPGFKSDANGVNMVSDCIRVHHAAFQLILQATHAVC